MAIWRPGLKEPHQGRTQFDMVAVLIETSRHRVAQKEDQVRTGEGGPGQAKGRGLSSGSNPTLLMPCTWSSGLRDGEKLNLCCVSCPVWYFVMAARADYYPLLQPWLPLRPAGSRSSPWLLTPGSSAPPRLFSSSAHRSEKSHLLGPLYSSFLREPGFAPGPCQTQSCGAGQ